jgi:hypothetical protein
MPKMTTDEARAWLKELAEETGAGSYEEDVADLTRRKSEDIEAVKSAYVQKYALRGATGGDRDRGGYSTELEDDPERVWTRGYAAEDATEGTEGKDKVIEKPWEKPTDDPRPQHSDNVRTRIFQMYDWFHEREPSTSELQDWLNRLYPYGEPSDEGGLFGDGSGAPTGSTSGPISNWSQMLFDGITSSPEYRTKGRKRLSELYKKYAGRDIEGWEINQSLRNPHGLLGVEWELAQNPGADYRRDNPLLKGQAGTEGTKGSKGRELQEASWNRDAPTAIAPPPPAPSSTIGDIVKTPVPQNVRPTAQPIAAPPKPPYSARPVTQPYSVNPMARPSPSSPNPYQNQPVYPPGMPSAPAYQGTMGPILSTPTSPQISSGADPASWENYDGYYGRSGQAYQAGPQGWGYNPAPWANTDRLLRGQFGRPGLTETDTNRFTDDGTDGLDESDADRRARRAYEFGRRDSLGNQYNADLGNQDFRSQMDRWIQSYNRWNQQGVDPFARPIGGRPAIARIDPASNTGGS